MFIQCAGTIQEVIRMNPATKYMLENVVMSDEMKQSGDEQTQETYMAGRFDVVNAKDYKAAQSRQKRVCQNVTSKEI